VETAHVSWTLRGRRPDRGRGLAAVVALAVTLLHGPAAVLACPACAARPTPGSTVFLWLALMIAVPYVIAFVTIRAIRRLERES
jgi:hypothetical protein